MGFSIYYRSTKPVDPEFAEAVGQSSRQLCHGRTWLSCEPPLVYQSEHDGHLDGSVKPNFDPHPDDVASAAKESLPDGTLMDALDALCQLSGEYGIDWEISHDHQDSPAGYIRNGNADELIELFEVLGDLVNFFQELPAEAKQPPSEFRPGTTRPDDFDESDDDDPPILPFKPK